MKQQTKVRTVTVVPDAHHKGISFDVNYSQVFYVTVLPLQVEIALSSRQPPYNRSGHFLGRRWTVIDDLLASELHAVNTVQFKKKMKSAKEKNAIHLYPLTLPRMKVPPFPLRPRAKKKNAWKLFCRDPTGQRTMNDVFASCSPERLNLLGRQMGRSVGDSNIPNIVTRADLTFVPLNLPKHSGELIVQCLNQTLFSHNSGCLRSHLSDSLLMVNGSIYVPDGY